MRCGSLERRMRGVHRCNDDDAVGEGRGRVREGGYIETWTMLVKRANAQSGEENKRPAEAPLPADLSRTARRLSDLVVVLVGLHARSPAGHSASSPAAGVASASAQTGPGRGGVCARGDGALVRVVPSVGVPGRLVRDGRVRGHGERGWVRGCCRGHGEARGEMVDVRSSDVLLEMSMVVERHRGRCVRSSRRVRRERASRLSEAGTEEKRGARKRVSDGRDPRAG